MSSARNLMQKFLGRVLHWVDIPMIERPRFGRYEDKRILFYSASNVGLGHLLRLLRIMRRLRARMPSLNMMLVTDSPHMPIIEAQNELAVVKLPGYTYRESSFREAPLGINLKKFHFRQVRSALLTALVDSYHPHLMLMDSAPHGKRNELQPILEHLSHQRNPPIRVMQMRDVPYVPVADEYFEQYRRKVIGDRRYYDYFFVAGNKAYFDLQREYEWPDSIREKLFYLGFVVPDRAPEADEPAPFRDDRLERMLREPARRIVASFGGGWEADTLGAQLIEAYANLANALESQMRFFLFTGPAVSDRSMRELQRRCEKRSDIYLHKFSPDFARLLNLCDLAVLQAGSTPFQILETDIPMLIYARDFKSREQQFRAARLARFPGIELIDREDLNPDRLARQMRELLTAPRVQRVTGFRYDGVERAARALARMLDHPARVQRPSIEELES